MSRSSNGLGPLVLSEDNAGSTPARDAICRHRLAVRTLASPARNLGSNPSGDTKKELSMYWILVVMATITAVPVPEEGWGGNAYYQSFAPERAQFNTAAECQAAAEKVRVSSGNDNRVIAFCDAKMEK